MSPTAFHRDCCTDRLENLGGCHVHHMPLRPRTCFWTFINVYPQHKAKTRFQCGGQAVSLPAPPHLYKTARFFYTHDCSILGTQGPIHLSPTRVSLQTHAPPPTPTSPLSLRRHASSGGAFPERPTPPAAPSAHLLPSGQLGHSPPRAGAQLSHAQHTAALHSSSAQVL